jgi:hypothetical protein
MEHRLGLRITFDGADRGLYPLGARTAVGRGLAGWADVMLEDPRVSGGKHFFVEWDSEEQAYFLQDTGHPNRITLNGVAVEPLARLRLGVGDTIAINRTTVRLEAL